jgi:purine nucleoside permease
MIKVNNFIPFVLAMLISTSAIAKKNNLTAAALAEKPIPIKIVIVTMFEIGNDTGDRPGELQNWVERLPLSDTLSFKQGKRALRYNHDKQILAISTGLGSINAASSIMALGMDPRFDLSHAYWLVAGVAGIDPADGSTGSAVWAEWLIDGDLSYHIDLREAPANWDTGYIPYNKKYPYEGPVDQSRSRNAIHLNSGLVNWAYGLTKNIALGDNEKLKKQRLLYTDYPNAQKAPCVLMGDNLSSMRFWYGKNNSEWANKWVKYWTNGKGNFVTSAMEDSGTAQALEQLTQAGKADIKRLLVLRTASDYVMQPPGVSAVDSFTGNDLFVAFIPSLESAFTVGKVVIDDLIQNWNKYREQIPGVESLPK